MKLLILGGTKFLGRAMVEAARQRGHEITLFNRGKSAPDLFPEIEQIHGDRATDLDRLDGRTWDVVIDTSAFVPPVARAAAEKLAGAVERYIFISSISALADMSKPGLDENDAVAILPEGESAEELKLENYGALKALCEQEVERAMPGRTLIIRPGLIVGPYDGSDRFTSWVCRVARGGEMLATGTPDDAVQFIDVRDLAEWSIRMAEERATGLYLATGPEQSLGMGQFLNACKEVAGSDARYVWVDEAFLGKRNIVLQPWVPSEYEGMRTTNCSKAIGAGLTFRPLDQTVRDTLTWKGKNELKYGLKPEEEQKLLTEWEAERSAQS